MIILIVVSLLILGTFLLLNRIVRLLNRHQRLVEKQNEYLEAIWGMAQLHHERIKAGLVAGFAALLLFIPSVSRADATTSLVTIAWTPPVTTMTNIATYNIYQGVASRAYTNGVIVSVTNTSSAFMLTRGVTYYFAASSVTANGLEGTLSTEFSYTSPIYPPPPTNLRVLSAAP